MPRSSGPRHHLPSYRDVLPGQTLEEAMQDEMDLRGHNQPDAALAMGTAQGNISRWVNPYRSERPHPVARGSARNVEAMIAYLRLRSLDDYVNLWVSSSLVAQPRAHRAQRPRRQ